MAPSHALVLFDLDGTLSDPLVGIGRSINYALSHFGYAERELKELAVHVGPPLDQAFRSLTGVEDSTVLESLVGKYRERYGKIGYSENVLYPGIEEALQSLSEAGVPMGVCTSKRVDFAEQILGIFRPRSYFRFVSGGEIGVHKWQQIEALLRKDLVSSSTVMVGDRAVDLLAAHRNGLLSAGVLWGHGSRIELESHQPHYLFSAPAELKSLAGANPSTERTSCPSLRAPQAATRVER